MHYRAPSRGGWYGSSPQTNAAGNPDRGRIWSGAVSAVRSSSAKSLWCLNLTESPEIRATFQRHFPRTRAGASLRHDACPSRLKRHRVLHDRPVRSVPSALGASQTGQQFMYEQLWVLQPDGCGQARRGWKGGSYPRQGPPLCVTAPLNMSGEKRWARTRIEKPGVSLFRSNGTRPTPKSIHNDSSRS